jgi:hypothetical protein
MATPHVSGIAALVLQNYCFDQPTMQTVLKIAGVAHRMTEDFHNASALVYAYQGGGVYAYQTFTWTPLDYGTGFLTADAAMFTASIFSPSQFMPQLGSCSPGCNSR